MTTGAAKSTRQKGTQAVSVSSCAGVPACTTPTRSGHETLAPPPDRTLVGSRGRRFWDGSGVWPVRPRLTSNVITPRSSANLVRPPILAVLDLPVMAADYAEQISHWIAYLSKPTDALTLHGSCAAQRLRCARASARSSSSVVVMPSTAAVSATCRARLALRLAADLRCMSR